MSKVFGIVGGVGQTAGAGVQAVFSRLNFLWQVLGVLVVGILLAKWTWIIFAPQTLSVLPKQSGYSGAVAPLFGTVAAVAVENTPTVATLPDVILVGVFTGKQGFAVLKLDEKKQLGVALGGEVSPGTKLVEVTADYVMLERNGVKLRVNLENKYAGSKGIQAVSATAAATSAMSPAADKAMLEWNKARREIQKRHEEADVQL
ncbi:MAG: type II secretion system protein N [Gallionellaceae bacterium]|jgi:hypothetical protein